jgi:hypothetical protein
VGTSDEPQLVTTYVRLYGRVGTMPARCIASSPWFRFRKATFVALISTTLPHLAGSYQQSICLNSECLVQDSETFESECKTTAVSFFLRQCFMETNGQNELCVNRIKHFRLTLLRQRHSSCRLKHTFAANRKRERGKHRWPLTLLPSHLQFLL